MHKDNVQIRNDIKKLREDMDHRFEDIKEDMEDIKTHMGHVFLSKEDAADRYVTHQDMTKTWNSIRWAGGIAFSILCSILGIIWWTIEQNDAKQSENRLR